jgi:mevalonate kinase
VILFGEHAVVYGEPAIASAIEVRLDLLAERNGSAPPRGHTVNGRPLDSHAHVHAEQALGLLWSDGPALRLRIESRIPSTAGLGSSAALSSALAAALLRLKGEATERRIAEAAYEIEYMAQAGRGSPTDTSTVTHGAGILVDRKPGEGLLWELRRGERAWFLHHLHVPPLTVVVGNTGVRGKTSDQVAKVARFVASNGFARDIIREIGSVVREGHRRLKEKDAEALGRLMDRNQKLLAILGVSTPELDRLCRAARPTSFGAKLTGSGGGGSMIALTDKPGPTAEAIRRAGGTPYVLTLGAAGLRNERPSLFEGNGLGADVGEATE